MGDTKRLVWLFASDLEVSSNEAAPTQVQARTLPMYAAPAAMPGPTVISKAPKSAGSNWKERR